MDLDLNIKNYQFEEIEGFFRLSFPYTLNDVLKNEREILNVIINDTKFKVERKNEFIEFMKKGKQQLITRLRNNLEKELGKELENQGELENEELLIKADIGKVVNQTSVQEMGGNSYVQNQETNRRVIVTVGFTHEVAAAVKALKSNEFVSADTPEKALDKSPLVREGEGEKTWKEKVGREMSAVEEKLKLAEERLKDTEEKNKTAKQLVEMHEKLKKVEMAIVASEKDTNKISSLVTQSSNTRMPASQKKKSVKKKAATKKSEALTPPPVPKRN